MCKLLIRRKRKTIAQPYDTSLKTWVKEDPAHIIPLLLPGATFQEAVDVEAIKPTMRADRVFKVLYRGKLCVMDIEFESGADDKMRARLLTYSAILYFEYELPVISIIVYPFRTTIATSPLVIEIADEEMIKFRFFTLPLFTLEAEKYIQEHLTCMYPLLPTMQGANAAVIGQAVAELATLYREDDVTLAQQLVWMELLLERTTTIAPEEKARIQGDIKVYDALWEEHPKVKRIKAQARAEVEKARAEARAETEKAKAETEKAKAEAEKAKAEALEKSVAEALEKARAEARVKEIEAQTTRDNIVRIVQVRFPELVDLAQQAVTHIAGVDGLKLLLNQVAGANDETVARTILQLSIP